MKFYPFSCIGDPWTKRERERERERESERRGKEEEVEKSPRTQIYTRRGRHLRIDSGDGGINTKA